MTEGGVRSASPLSTEFSPTWINLEPQNEFKKPEKQHLVFEDLFFCTLTLAGSAETCLMLNPQHAGKSQCGVKHFDWLKKTRKGFYIPIASKLRRG